VGERETSLGYGNDPVVARLAADVAAVQAIEVVPAILRVVCKVTGMGFAAVARVTEDRWIACALQDEIDFGLPVGGELPVKTTICSEVREHGKPVIIPDVLASPEFAKHYTPALYGFRSYISLPIVRADGSIFGTLCAIDPRPAQLDNPEIRTMFELFAQLIAFHFDAAEQIGTNASKLAAANANANLREQFIAVLGHDLRNPVAAIDSGIAMLKRSGDLGERSRRIVEMMQASIARATGLIDDVLDFARGRLGGGVALNKFEAVDFNRLITEAITEVRSFSPDARIEFHTSIDGPVKCDRGRMLQLVSNLLGNALTHGRADLPIRVRASRGGGWIVVEIANSGDPIPETVRSELFEPFFRSVTSEQRAGLGLGLFIASQIAKAHHGDIDVRSDETETVFTARIADQPA